MAPFNSHDIRTGGMNAQSIIWGYVLVQEVSSSGTFRKITKCNPNFASKLLRQRKEQKIYPTKPAMSPVSARYKPTEDLASIRDDF